jgi:hypothetical protein
MSREWDGTLDMALRMAERMLEMGASASSSDDDEGRKLGIGGELYAAKRLEQINDALAKGGLDHWDRRPLEREKERLERKLGLL